MEVVGGRCMKIDAMKAQLSKIERQRHALTRQIQALQEKRLAALPAQVGLDSIDGLILALMPHASSTLRTKLQAIDLNGAEGEALGAGYLNGDGNGKRARFPEALKAQIKAELEVGKKSVAQLSREYGPSHPTIMGWKREWGMTHPRPRKSAAR
jgi:hypothetical protein